MRDKNQRQVNAPGKSASTQPRRKPISLKLLAKKLGLSQATVSMALSEHASSTGVALKTRERVQKAALQYNYRPNYFARYLSMGRSNTVAILVPEIDAGYYSSVIAAIEKQLMLDGYYYLVSSHHWNPLQVDRIVDVFMDRGAEGIIMINTLYEGPLSIPGVKVGGREKIPGITNVRIHEQHGAMVAMEHLARLGHKRIAVFKGDKESTATQERWESIRAAAKKFQITIPPEAVLQLDVRGDFPRPADGWSGYALAKTLLERKAKFTALFAHNDTSAIGAMRAFQEAGLSIPQDISVIGYDDIPNASLERPSLTTVRQSLHEIGTLAAKALVQRINGTECGPEFMVEPELIERESTSQAPVVPRKTR